MAATHHITPPATFDAVGDPSSMGQRWKKYRDGFVLYFKAAGITDPEQKKSLLLHCGGESLQDVFSTLPDPPAPVANDDDGANNNAAPNAYDSAIAKLDIYFLPMKNKRYERHVFRSRVQKEGETISQYVTQLRTLSETCEFGNKDDEIVDQVIEKCRSRRLRKSLLKIEDLDITKLLKTAHVSETSEHQAKQYEKDKAISPAADVGESSDEGGVNRIEVGRNKFGARNARRGNQQYQKSAFHRKPKEQGIKGSICYRCGSVSHLANNYTDFNIRNKKCLKCGKLGHIMKVCRANLSNVNSVVDENVPANTRNAAAVRYLVADSSSDEEEQVFCLSSGLSNNMYPIIMNSMKISVLIDSGSSVNVISQSVLDQLPDRPKLLSSNKKIYAFNASSPMPVVGCIRVNVMKDLNEKPVSAEFIVVQNTNVTILGYQTATELDLLRVGPPIKMVNAISSGDHEELKSLLSEYKDRFDGIGKLKGVVAKIHIDGDVKPVVQNYRRQPILLERKIDVSLDKLLELDVIEAANEPPEWVNPLIPVHKEGTDEVRLAVDMRAANEAIIREPYKIPTLEDVVHDFNGCKVFAKLDLNKAYHQIELAPECRNITSFICHRGIFRFKVLFPGMSAASEICQRNFEVALAGLPKVRNISDDIFVGGKDAADLLANCRKLFKRLRANDLTLNLKKCEFLKEELIYMGHKLSAEGIAPDPRKVEAITALTAPKNIHELRSFLGMVTYCSKFLPTYTKITAPLRELLKGNTKWIWTDEHEKTFNKLKNQLVCTEVLAYYNPEAETEVTVDASPSGLGAVLRQKQGDGIWKPVSYASRALTSVESRYGQVERECLAVYFGINRFKMYLYGLKFKVYTDHKPLIPMFKSTKLQMTPRIERWILKLTGYDFELHYLPGVKNSADYLSRSNPLSINRKKSESHTEGYINAIVTSNIPVAMSLDEIQKETKADTTINVVIKRLSC